MSRVVVVGSVNVDLTATVAHLPAPGETIVGTDPASLPGGKGANQAVAAGRQHDDVAFVGAVGADEFGALAISTLVEARVDVSEVVATDASTGLAMITVGPGGENTIVVCPGANSALGGAVGDAVERLTRAGDVILLQMEIPLAADLAAAHAAHRCGARVVLNAAPLAEAGPQRAELISVTDVLVVNEGEARTLTGVGADADDEQVAARLSDLGVPRVVITVGERGAIVVDRGQLSVLPAQPVDVVDTTGAGDAFCATVGVGLAAGDDLLAVVRRACAAGALSTTVLGAQSALPDAARIDRLLAEGRVA